MDDRFLELLQTYRPSLSRLAASYTANATERDDLLQEIAIGIWRALPHFRGESSERTFIFRIAQNRAISHVAERPPYAGSVEEALEVPDHRSNPEKELSRDQETERLLRAIQSLSLPYRQVMTLALEDLSYTETAEVLGISESNVGVRLNRARQMLRQMLEVSR